MDQHEPGPHTLWPEALGLFVPLNIIAFYTTKLRTAQLHFQIGLFIVFLVSNIVVFQPWEVSVRPVAVALPFVLQSSASVV